MSQHSPLNRTILLAAAIGLWGFAAARGDELEDARQAFHLGRMQQCLPLAELAVEKRVWNEEAWRLLIAAQLHTGRSLEAADHLALALRKFSSSLPLRVLGRDVLRSVGAAEQGDELFAEIEILARARPERFSDPASQVALGTYFLNTGADARQVLTTFYDSVRKDHPDYAEAHLAAGELALSKEDYGVAAAAFQQALKADPQRTAAHFGLALAFAPSDSERAEASLQQVLELSPQYLPALMFIADRQIDAESYDAAEATLNQALEVNPDWPPAWAALSVLAHLRADAGREQFCRRVALGWWAANPEVDHLIGRKLSQKYRFAEGAAFQRQALELAPQYHPALRQLSQDLLRLGQEEEGWRLADAALQQDGYDVVAHNLARLHDKLRKFRTLQNDHFIVRMEEREAAIYGDAVLELLERARAALCDKYRHELRVPVIVEIFPQQADFAARTFGLPGGEGFLGVCFGNVITANSPASQGGSPANWASVLWHEFCHVVTLQKTNNRMPRWLSEGISVYEERQQRRSWGQTMTATYRKMILGDELTPVSQLSGAFLRPKSGLHLQFAYYESSLVVEYLIERHGFDALLRILQDLSQGMAANDALARCTGSIEALDGDFAQFARQRAAELAADADWTTPEAETAEDPAKLAKWLAAHPDSLFALQRRARELFERQEWAEARAALRKLAEHLPRQTGPEAPWAMVATCCHNLEDTAGEREAWRRVLEADSQSQAACLRLIELAVERKDWPAALEAANRQLEINPLRTDVHLRRAEAAEQSQSAAAASQSLEALLQLDPADPAGLHFRLARSLLQQRHRDAARRHTLMALEEAPRYRAAQQLLLRLTRRPPRETAPEAETSSEARP